MGKIKTGMARSAVQVRIRTIRNFRTIRNCGVSHLNLSDFEKKIIQESIIAEIEEFKRNQKKFKLNHVSEEFKKTAL